MVTFVLSSFFPLAGDPALKSTSIEEDDDISPSLDLLQTEDQNSPGDLEDFVPLSPPAVDDYLFALGDNEGISDLFDAYDLFKTWFIFIVVVGIVYLLNRFGIPVHHNV